MCRLGSSEIGLGCSLQHISRSGVAKQLHVEFFRLGCLSSLKSGIQSSTSSLFSLVPTQSQSLPHESETDRRVWITPKVKSTLDTMKNRYQALCAQLSETDAGDLGSYGDINRELADLEPIVSLAKTIEDKKTEIANLKSMLEEASTEQDLRELALQEQQELTAQLPNLEEDLVLQLLPKDEDDSRPAIVEIRAGVGGDEGALFALDLFNMYRKYAMASKWQIEVLSLQLEEMGGCKQASMSILGAGAYGKLKYEIGVHRVQRNPKTEMTDRIHTSTASVVVFPKVEEVDVSLNPEDLNIEVMRASGAGGQHVNTTESAVRITHKPTGISVMMQDERSQHSNRKRALSFLMAKLYELEQTKRRESLSDIRKSAVGSRDRSARIRTYNYPQGRITDHRIGLTVYGMEDMMNGSKLDSFIQAMHIQDQMSQLEDFKQD